MTVTKLERRTVRHGGTLEAMGFSRDEIEILNTEVVKDPTHRDRVRIWFLHETEVHDE